MPTQYHPNITKTNCEMDTRSVVRSHRRSTRLSGQPPREERAKQPVKSAACKRRDSDRDAPSRASSNASREGSHSKAGDNPNTSSIQDAQPDPPNTNATDVADEGETKSHMLPLFPNLSSSKGKSTQSHRADADSISVATTARVGGPVDTASGNTVSTKWVKTARGSIRLASDSPAESTKHDADKKSGAIEEGQRGSSATARRRSSRLASMTPDVGGEEVEVEPTLSRSPAQKAKGVATASCASDFADSAADKESESDLRDQSTGAISEHDPSTRSTHHGELPIQERQISRLLQDHDIAQNLSPIPELVADIEKIIQSSPLAAQSSADDNIQGQMASTSADPSKQREHANVTTRSRTLRSSLRSVENASKLGKRLDSESTDSESQQFDGAFDDSLRDQRKKKAQAPGGPAITSTPSEPRGTKRNAKGLSPDVGDADTPGPRQQRRRPGSDDPKPEFDLGSANPIERATSRGAFSVDDPGIDDSIDIGEFARRSDEPANPVMLAQMISADREREDSPIDSNAADDGSEDDEPAKLARLAEMINTKPDREDSPIDSDAADDGSEDFDPEKLVGLAEIINAEPERDDSPIDSIAADDGSEGASRRQTPAPEGDGYKCADCGRSPAKYLVCAKCHEAVYCGKYCQLWDWPQHRARCRESEDADRAEAEAQEAYLRGMWEAALEMLRGEKAAGGTVESLLLGEAVQHSPAWPAFMGQRNPRAFAGFDVDDAQLAPSDSQSVDGTRAMSMRLAQAALGGDE